MMGISRDDTKHLESKIPSAVLVASIIISTGGRSAGKSVFEHFIVFCLALTDIVKAGKEFIRLE